MRKSAVKNLFALKKIEGESVHLSGEEGEVVVPKKLLSGEVLVGDKFVVTVSDQKSEAEKNHVTAREILNEILKPRK